MAYLPMPDLGQVVHVPPMAALAQPGVYFLLYEGVVVYVGQARDMRRRISDHIAEGTKAFDAVLHVPCSVERLMDLERRYIEKLVPKYNRCTLALSRREAGVGHSGVLRSRERKVRVPRSNERRTIRVLRKLHHPAPAGPAAFNRTH